MFRKMMCVAVMAVLFAGAGSAFAQGFAGSETERTGKLYNKTIGIGNGYVIGLDHFGVDLNFQAAIGNKFRVEVGGQFLMLWGLDTDYDFLLDEFWNQSWYRDIKGEDDGDGYGYGLFASFQYRYSISKDGFFNTYAGPLVTYHTVSGSTGAYRLPSSIGNYSRGYNYGEDYSGKVFGVGLIIGIEWDYSNRIQTADFGGLQIRYRNNYCISLDLRPVINLVAPYDWYPILQVGVGFTGRYMF